MLSPWSTVHILLLSENTIITIRLNIAIVMKWQWWHLCRWWWWGCKIWLQRWQISGRRGCKDYLQAVMGPPSIILRWTWKSVLFQSFLWTAMSCMLSFAKFWIHLEVYLEDVFGIIVGTTMSCMLRRFYDFFVATIFEPLRRISAVVQITRKHKEQQKLWCYNLISNVYKFSTGSSWIQKTKKQKKHTCPNYNETQRARKIW